MFDSNIFTLLDFLINHFWKCFKNIPHQSEQFLFLVVSKNVLQFHYRFYKNERKNPETLIKLTE